MATLQRRVRIDDEPWPALAYTERETANMRTTPHEIAANVASIQAVPERVLSGRARQWALMWARRGYDVYAYASGGSTGTWCLWYGERIGRVALGRVEPGDDTTARHLMAGEGE